MSNHTVPSLFYALSVEALNMMAGGLTPNIDSTTAEAEALQLYQSSCGISLFAKVYFSQEKPKMKVIPPF